MMKVKFIKCSGVRTGEVKFKELENQTVDLVGINTMSYMLLNITIGYLKTSSIKDVVIQDNKIIVTTLNSVYELEI